MATFGSIYPYSSIYPGKFEGDPFAATIAAPSWDSDFTGMFNKGIRQVVAASQITTGGTQVKVTFWASTAGTGIAVDGAFIGHQAVSGDAWDFDGGQVRLTFSTANGFDISTGSSITSDPVAFTLDETKNLVLSAGVANDGAKDDTQEEFSTTGFDIYTKSGGLGEEGTTDVTGYSTTASNRMLFGEVLVA